MDILENEIKNPILRDDIYDLLDKYINTEEYNNYLNLKTENERDNFNRNLKYLCHPRYFERYNLRYCEIERIKYLYDRYEELRNEIKEYCKNNSFSITPSLLYLDSNKAYKFYTEFLDFYLRLDIFDKCEHTNRLSIFNNLIKYIESNLKKDYVIDNKINYEKYYDNNYFKINFIMNNLLSPLQRSNCLDKKLHGMKYQII